MSKPIVVVGSGLAAYLFAKEFRQLDKERSLIIVTKSDGCFYSKPLLSTALTQKKLPKDLEISDAAAMSKKMIAEVIPFATVTQVNAAEKEMTYEKEGASHTIEYGDLILACGADKLHASISGDAVASIQSVNNIEDYRDFRHWLHDKEHIAIMGAGFVGCEFANDLLNSGHKVSVVAAESFPLSRLLPKKMGDVLANALATAGVDWKFERLVKQVDHHEQGFRVLLDDGSELFVDGVMSAVGLKPHLDLAIAAGIDTNLGIVVDNQLRSSDKNIYALGDCAEVNGICRQYVAPILQASRVLAKVLTNDDVSLHYPVMPVVVKTPVCPVIAVPVANDAVGEWYYEGEGCNRKALFKDENQQLQGFVLLGEATREKAELLKSLNAVKI